jgi:sensor histidine kinase YesM
MKFKKHLFIAFLILGSMAFEKNAKAQLQPSYFKIQKQEGLQSASIFNIHAAKNGLIYIAHAKGISSFDGNHFKNYPNKSFPYTELSNILETSNGEIYCKSFNNVLYKIVKDSTEQVAFYPNNTGYTSSACNNNTIVSMGNDSVFLYNTLIKKAIKIHKDSIAFGPMPDKYIFSALSIINNEQVLLVVDNNNIPYKMKWNEKLIGALHFNKGNTFVVKDKSVEKIYHLNEKEALAIKEIMPNTIVNYITTIDTNIWICTTNGLYYYSKNKGISSIKYILKEYNITDIDKTFENNYIISTIGNGLIFIPSFDVNYLPNTPTNITKIARGKDELLIGTKEGKVWNYNIDNFSKSMLAKDISPIQFLLYDDNLKTIVNSFSNQSANFSTYKPSSIIKDYTYIKEELILATNSGLFIYSKTPIASWLNNYVQNSKTPFKKLSFCEEYVASVKFDSVHQTLYTNTYAGLFEMKNGYTKPVKLPEPNCVLKDMACYNGLLYLATKDQGIITWDGEKYQPLKNNNPTQDILLKFETYENELWVLGENAIYCYTKNEYKKYDKKFGVDLDKAINIVVEKNDVYINNGTTIERFPKNILYDTSKKPLFVLNSVYSKMQKKQITPNAILNYKDNFLTINYSLIAFVNAAYTHLCYVINHQDTFHLQNNTRQINLNNLTPDNYSLKFFVVSNDIINPTSEVELKFEIKAPMYKRWWFTLLLFLLGGFIVYVISNYILKNWKKEALHNEAKLLLEKELDKSMLTSIKSQMNPHFLFNALNTVQSYIYANDKHNASMYISKFSELTRSILDMSNKEIVLLEEEINSLKLYLELEKMRFEDSFNYTIHIDESINKERCKIPSMLVQPYVENAIKHGLLHKKTNRILTLSYKKENELLKIIIDDNGIGRKRSGELNNIKNRKHESFAMNANKKRLEILKNTYEHINFEIVDKFSPMDEPMGTTVIITLPY